MLGRTRAKGRRRRNAIDTKRRRSEEARQREESSREAAEENAEDSAGTETDVSGPLVHGESTGPAAPDPGGISGPVGAAAPRKHRRHDCDVRFGPGAIPRESSGELADRAKQGSAPAHS